MRSTGRTVFETLPLVTFSERHISSCAVSNLQQPGQQRLFTGTADCSLRAYDCRGDIGASRGGRYEATIVESIWTAESREGACVSQIAVFDTHALLVAIVDGAVVVYDMRSLRVTAHVRDVRGVLSFAAHVPSRTLILFFKKKAKLYFWQHGGVLQDPKREYALPETPTCACCLSDKCVVVANKRSFDVLSLNAILDGDEGIVSGTKMRGVFGGLGSGRVEVIDGSVSAVMRKLLDAPGGTGCIMIVPGGHSCPEGLRLLTSSQTEGILFSVRAISAFLELPSMKVPCPLKGRISWSTTPVALKTVSVFLVALLGSTVEVHFAPTLTHVQTISLEKGISATALCGGSNLGEDTQLRLGLKKMSEP